MATSNRIKAEMYILFSCSAWHEYSSFEPEAVSSSIERAVDLLQKSRRKLKLEEDDIECFRQYSQTQGKNTNYLVQSCPYNPVRAKNSERQRVPLINNHIKYMTMVNDEDTYIEMSLSEGIRYITAFGRGNFESYGRTLKTFYRTEDRVRELLVLGNLLHLGGGFSSNENKISCWPLNNENPIHEAKEIPDKGRLSLLGDWAYLHENGRWFPGCGGEIYEISNPEFPVFVPNKGYTPSPLGKGLSFVVIDEIGKLEFTPEIVDRWDTWKSLPKRASKKGRMICVFRKTQLIRVIKPKELES